MLATQLAELKKVAVRHLSRRSYTEYQLRQKLQQALLKQQGHAVCATDELESCNTIQLIQQVIDYCYHYQWLNDQQYVKDYLYYKSRRGYGLERIKLELKQRGIDESLLDLRQQESACDWLTILQQLAYKKFPQLFESPRLIDYKLRAKIIRYFSARGFSFEQINALFNLSDE